MNTKLATLLGAKIKYYRGLQNMEQQQLAAHIGLSVQYLSKIERGRQMPSLHVLCLIADCLAIEPYLLLKP